MLRKSITGLFLALTFAALAFPQTKPNFTGTWKLIPAKSDFGPMPPPESQTAVIAHDDPAFKMNVSGNGPMKMDYNLEGATDGKEMTIKMGPREAKVTVAWEGPAVVANFKININEQDVTMKATLTLADDGKTLNMVNHIAMAMGEFDQKMVYEKTSDSAVMTAKAEAPKVEAPKTPTAPAMGGEKPNFSGVWKLNVAKSDFGVMPPPDSRTDTIEHKEPTLKLARDEKGAEGARNYIINTSNDGKEVINNWGGMEVKITANWEGPALAATIKLKFQDNDIVIKQTSTLSADGKVLTNKNHIMSPMGELDQTEVYEKQ
jgi:hypothetical protein